MNYQQLGEDFGFDDVFGLVAIIDADLFSKKKLTAIANLTNKLEELDGVEKVVSITNIERNVWRNDTLYREPVLPENTGDTAALEKGKHYLLESEETRNNIISADGKACVILIEIDADRNTSDTVRRPILEPIWAKINAARPHFDKVLDGGIPLVRSKVAGIIHDTTIYQVPLASLVIFIILAITFRHWAGVVLSLMIVLLAMFLTLGVMAISDGSITILSTLLPVILLITGVADAIHFHSRYYEELKNGNEKLIALRQTIKHMAVACFITSFTTAIGFSVLGFTNIRILREYGIYVGAGVIFAYIITITLLPALLSILPAPPKHIVEGYFNRGAGRWTGWVSRQVTGHTNRWAIISIIFIILSIAGAWQVRKSTRILEDLAEDHPIMQSENFFEEKMGGVLPLEIIIETRPPNTLKTPEAVKAIDDLTQFMRSIPEIRKAFSASDLLRSMHQVIINDPHTQSLPNSPELIAQYILLYGMNDDNPMESFWRPDSMKTRISARIKDGPSERAWEIRDIIESYVRENMPKGLNVHISGTWAIAHKVNVYVVDQIFYTFILAFAVIFLALSIQFRSIRIALLSMIPNIIPLLAGMSIMVFDGITLKPTSAVIFSIAFGIAVDDTIHFLSRFLTEFPKDQSYSKAITRTLGGTGHAMITTTIILATGFLVPYFFSEILSNRNFSILSIGCVLTALFGDLFVMPVLLLKVKPRI